MSDVRTRVVRCIAGAELWHDQDRRSFATIGQSTHLESHAVSSRFFEQFLVARYGVLYPATLGDGSRIPGTMSQRELRQAVQFS